MPRRALLRGGAGLLAACLGGCGFRPLHGGSSGTGDSEIAAELAAIRVELIGERFGQLLRRNLQQRLATGTGGGAQPPARWALQAAPSIAAEPLGIQRDGQVTRVRYIATVNWSLQRLTPPEVVANGFERAIDAFNVQPNQFFAADLSRDSMERRLAATLAEEVVTRLAVRLQDLRDGTAARLIEPVETPPPLPQAPLSAPAGTLVPSPGGGLGGGIGGGVLGPMQ